MERSKMIYGKHLMLRIAKIKKHESLNDEEAIFAFLKSLVARLGMRVLAGPVVGNDDSGALKEGCSGIILLYESHAAIHTYTKQKEAFIDIFSCKDFETTTVFKVITATFGDFTILEEQVLSRGHHWNENLDAEYEAWTSKK